MRKDERNDFEKLQASNEQLSLQIVCLNSVLRERNKLERELFTYLKDQNTTLQKSIVRQNSLLVKALLGGVATGIGGSYLISILIEIIKKAIG